MKNILTFKKFNEAMQVDIFGNIDSPDCLSAHADDDINDAYDKGIEAKSNDYDLDENPYVGVEEELFYAWVDGWNSK